MAYGSSETVLNRMQDYVGTITIGDYGDESAIVAKAFNTVLDTVSKANHKLFRSTNLSEGTDSAGTTVLRNALFLQVNRYDSVSSRYYPAKRAQTESEFLNASDSNSIHEATDKSPMYFYGNNGVINWAPSLGSGDTGQIYYINYFEDNISLSSSIATLNANVPYHIEEAMILASCSAFMKFKIADSTIDDEDNELFDIYSKNLAIIEGKLKEELARLALAN